MEIKQIRAYNLETLVGNGGGYVGLFLGCSFIQLPCLIYLMYNKIKKYAQEKHSSLNN